MITRNSQIPAVFKDYVPFGFFDDLLTVVASKKFYPVFITGHSGNGKTLMVEQVCAQSRRDCIRVNISTETDENDLIGGHTMIEGNIKFNDGPVLTAMRNGAILLLDEIDRGSDKLLCLQSVLEGKPYFNKKTGELVQPAPGFNVIATANTKGRGSDEGRYLAKILDDAFLERFPITVEQEYPTAKVETKILKALTTDMEFVEELVKWAEVIRKTFDDGGIDEIISTRRLVHIVEAYNMYRNKMHAIELCTNRFDEDTKQSFRDLYTKISAAVTANTVTQVTKVPEAA